MNHPTYRYRVTRTWGQVPEQVKSIIGKADAYLLYPEYRGLISTQGFTDHGELVGGWQMRYSGERPADDHA